MQEITTDKDFVCPSSQEEWRSWLEDNHATKKSVWLIYYKKKAAMPTLSWDQAVDEALCFGWIDSIGKPIDENRYMQFFCPRKPKSAWSKINKEKVARLSAAGLISAAGLKAIEIAIENGSWDALNEVESLVMPKDLQKAFGRQIRAKRYFNDLSKSVRKAILQWVLFAKRAETRTARINEVVRFCSDRMIPKQFRP
jgi:uncharacterized protein YdeI (YjbR/CyaY-like superfamily)